MVIEQKCFISPSDIVAVQIECNKCLTTISVPTSKLLNNHMSRAITGNCPQCAERWGLDADTPEIETFTRFHEYLVLMQKMLTGGRNFKYRLETKGLAAS